jgi:hypothetical protein
MPRLFSSLAGRVALGLGALILIELPKANGQEEPSVRATSTSTVPRVISVNAGDRLPDLLLEDGRGRRFSVSELGGRPVVLTIGFIYFKWRESAHLVHHVAYGRATVLHLASVPPVVTDDAPGTPPIPFKDLKPDSELRRNVRGAG